MAKQKSGYFPYKITGQVGMYCKVKQASTGYFLDNADGAFRAVSAIPNIPLAESLTTPSVYYFNENRRVWSDGEYQMFAYTSTNVIFSLGGFYIYNDEEVSDSVMQSDSKRLLGLLHENIFIDNPIYDVDGNLISARVRIYSTSGDVGTDNNVIGTYLIAVTASGVGKFLTWSQVRS
jgi:hypothetical protein